MVFTDTFPPLSTQPIDETTYSLSDSYNSPTYSYNSFDVTTDRVPETATQKFVKNFLVAPVKDLINCLVVIRRTISSVADPYIVANIDYKNLDQRFGQPSEEHGGHCVKPYTDLHKLQKDIGVIIFLLNSITLDMTTYGGLYNTDEYINYLMHMREDEENLLSELDRKQKLRQDLRRAFVKERQKHVDILATYNNLIDEKAREMRYNEAYCKISLKYQQNWQNARYEQNNIRLQKKQAFYFDSILYERMKMEMEDRCHEDLELFIRELEDDYHNEMQHWMKNYEDTVDEKETQIYNLQMEIEKLSDSMERTKIEYEDRSQEIEEWLEYKKKKQEEENLLRLKNEAALKIQNWWRGVMLEKHLGSYKLGKKKTAIGKKNKKDKKSNM